MGGGDFGTVSVGLGSLLSLILGVGSGPKLLIGPNFTDISPGHGCSCLLKFSGLTFLMFAGIRCRSSINRRMQLYK